MANKNKNTRSGLISTGRVSENRRARHDYAIGETFEAGLVLQGTEVKSLRQGRANLSESYAGGPTGAELFDLSFVFIETMLLLLSSAACGMAILAMHAGKDSRVLQWLALTFLLGLGFIAMELHEFQLLIAEGHGPGRSAYLSAFFTLVGTHGLHVASGLVWMAVMMYQVKTKGLSVMVQARMMRLSMFWHFLDIVWVAVFTVVYLMGAL